MNDYFNVDQDIETTGIEAFEENEIETASLKPSIDVIINEKNNVEIEDALNSVKILNYFYYGEWENNATYNHLLDIEQDLQEKGKISEDHWFFSKINNCTYSSFVFPKTYDVT